MGSNLELKKKQVPSLNFGFLARLKTEKFNKDTHIKDFDFQLERELSMMDLMKIRSSNYDTKCENLYDVPGLTTFGLDENVFHFELESKFRVLDESVKDEPCQCKSMCAIF